MGSQLLWTLRAISVSIDPGQSLQVMINSFEKASLAGHVALHSRNSVPRLVSSREVRTVFLDQNPLLELEASLIF